MSRDEGVGYYVALSAAGAALILVIAFLGAEEGDPASDLERILVGGCLILSALFGMSIAIRPGWPGRLARKDVHGIDQGRTMGTTGPPGRRRLGHHPDCAGFESHRLARRKGAYCAGCLGLSLGATAAMILAVLHTVVPGRLTGDALYVVLILGIAVVFLNFGELSMAARNPYIHVLSNAALVVGFLMVVLGVLELTGSVLYSLFGILISFLWLDTRIRLSGWRHRRICENCGEGCKAY